MLCRSCIMKILWGIWVWTRICDCKPSQLGPTKYYRNWLLLDGGTTKTDPSAYSTDVLTCLVEAKAYVESYCRQIQIIRHSQIIKSSILINYPFISIIPNGIITLRIIKTCYNWFERKSSWHVFFRLQICFIATIVVSRQRFFWHFIGFLI